MDIYNPVRAAFEAGLTDDVFGNPEATAS